MLSYDELVENKEEIFKNNRTNNTIYYDYRDSLSEDIIFEIIQNLKDYSYDKDNFLEDFDDRLIEYLVDLECERIEEGNDDIINEVEEWIQDNLDETFSLEESPDEDLIKEFISDNIELDFDIETLKRNTIIKELAIIITPSKYTDDDFYRLSKFSNELYPDTDIKTLKENKEEILEDLNNKNEPNVINWLIQSQGYEFSDLYDIDKVKESKFLKSLKSELKDYCTQLNGHLTISATNVSLEDFLNCEISDQNILIKPNKNLHLGIFDSINGGGSGMSIELEKDLIIPKEWKHTVCSFDGISHEGPGWYRPNQVYDFSDVTGKKCGIFSNTKEEPIKLKEIKFEDLIKSVKKTNVSTKTKKTTNENVR